VAVVEVEVTPADGFAMKYRFNRGLLAILLVGITFFYPLLAPTPHRIDETHFRLIQKGMLLAQVESIFGVPPGEYDHAERDYAGLVWTTVTNLQGDPDVGVQTLPKAFTSSGWARISFVQEESRTWSSCNGCFTISIDGQNRVTSTSSWPHMRRVPPWSSFWEKIFGKK
jgi:hypothetical protein